MPVGRTVHELFERPRTTRPTAGLVLSGIPVVGVDRGVAGVGFVNDLQFDIQIGCLPVEGVHASVGHGDIDVAGPLTYNAKEAVGW